MTQRSRRGTIELRHPTLKSHRRSRQKQHGGIAQNSSFFYQSTMDTEKDADYEPPVDSDNDTTSPTLRRRRASTMVPVARANSGKKKRRTGEKAIKPHVLPKNLKGCATKLQHLKKRLQGSYFDAELSKRVVHMAVVLQKEYLVDLDKNKTERGRKVPPAQIRKRICKYLGISSATYQKIMSKEEERTVFTSQNTGNTAAKDSRVPKTEKTKLLVREFVRKERAERRRVTAVQVLEFLVDQGIVHIRRCRSGEGHDKKDYHAAHRSVQRWLVANDYRRGKRTGNVVMKEHIAAHRDRYLQAFFENREKPPGERLREIYLDESYIHQHYRKDAESIWDPNDEQDLQIGKLPNKGNRYCFLAAIKGPGLWCYTPTYDHAEDKKWDTSLHGGSRAGIVPGSVWCFCPQQKKLHKGDYHKAFNGSNFIQWWKDQLLPNLTEPSLIIMDNASYHKTWPDFVPKLTANKADLQAYLTRSNVAFHPKDTKPILKELVRAQRAKEKTVCEELAEKEGHQVLYTPPHHSDFQPIELLWAKLKGNIGRKYDSTTTMAVLKQRLDEESLQALIGMTVLLACVEKHPTSLTNSGRDRSTPTPTIALEALTVRMKIAKAPPVMDPSL